MNHLLQISVYHKYRQIGTVIKMEKYGNCFTWNILANAEPGHYNIYIRYAEAIILKHDIFQLSELGFESERLYMRKFSESDLEDFHDVSSDPDIGPNAGWAPHESIEASKKILDEFLHSETKLYFVITDKMNGRYMGSISLSPDSVRADKGAMEIGYVLGKPFWGKGYMTECVKAILKFGFEKLGLTMMTIYHFPFNDRSRRVIEKCGFIKEGTIRRGYEYYDGTFLDEVAYSMTSEEYREIYG